MEMPQSGSYSLPARVSLGIAILSATLMAAGVLMFAM
jgi:hypothetical protein